LTERLRRQRTVIQEKFDKLVQFMDPHSELLDKLVPLRVFAEEVIEEIRAEQTRRRRNEKILDHLRYVDKDGYSNFLRALNDSCQTHVVNFINGILNAASSFQACTSKACVRCATKSTNFVAQLYCSTKLPV